MYISLWTIFHMRHSQYTYFIFKMLQKDDLNIAHVGVVDVDIRLLPHTSAQMFITEYCLVLEDVYTKDSNIVGLLF